MSRSSRTLTSLVTLAFASGAFGCTGGRVVALGEDSKREPCDQRDDNGIALYGDLHVHTRYSFDAGSYGTEMTPASAYAFAQGATALLASEDPQAPERRVRLDVPLDFVAVTDHGDLLGEVAVCTDSTGPTYDSPRCQAYRADPEGGALAFGQFMASSDPQRKAEICGEDLSLCGTAAKQRWQDMVAAADDASDATTACSFTAFPAYEYTNTRQVSNLHRNVVFKGGSVPDAPVSYYEAPHPEILWETLKEECRDGDPDCDVVVLPHNSNLSNGRLFDVDDVRDPSPEGRLKAARLRAEMEPVAEIFQHKGDSECRNGFADVDAPADPLCDFEKLRPVDADQCGDEEGTGGMRLFGCSHRHDFLRNVLKTGLLVEQSQGVNPFAFGFIGSTDTHNGTPGYVSSIGFQGHVGVADDTAEKRLGDGTVTHDGIIENPGGLAAVWAEENSREAVFAALRRRETFATSGPRMKVRLFGGFGYRHDMCTSDNFLTEAYVGGVPMGTNLATRSGGNTAPTFAVQAEQDTGPSSDGGASFVTVPLHKIQIVKGWVAGGVVHEKVYDVVSSQADPPASVDLATCEPLGKGATSLCSVWSDPDFDPTQSAFYYARALQNPTCRWSWRECLDFPETDRPSGCAADRVLKVLQHRVWSSPIWLTPSP